MLYQYVKAYQIAIGDRVILPMRTPGTVVSKELIDDPIWGAQYRIGLDTGVKIFSDENWRFKVVCFEIPPVLSA